MAISLKHTFQSAKADGADTTLVQPSNWNAEHTITAAAGKVLGRDTSGAGAVQELPIAVDTGGNVGIGTSSPAAPYKLDVNGAVRSTAGVGFSINANNPDFRMVTTDGRGWRMGATSSGTSLGYFYIQGTTDNFTTSFISGPTIDSAGNVGIGTSSPTEAKLQVNGNIRAGVVTSDPVNSNANIYTLNNVGGTLSSLLWRFVTGANDTSAGTERMRIDSAGNLLVGTTVVNPALASTQGCAINPGYANFCRSGTVIYATQLATGGLVEFRANGSSLVGSISVTGSATAYNTSSDARLKENITNADSASSLIDAIQVRQFDWKADGSHQRYGMVAQELLEVAPEAVSVPADEEQMMGVDYSKLVPMLVKEIQSLRARVAQLEGK